MRARLAILLATAAASACASGNEAPVVYGSHPTWQGRIYSSRADLPPVPAAQTARAVPSKGSGDDKIDQRLTRASFDEGDLLGDLIEPGAVIEKPNRRTAALTADDIYLEDSLVGGHDGGGGASSLGFVRVRTGDTVYAISRRTGVSPEAIIAENRLRAPYHLEVGQSLKVPGTKPTQVKIASVTRATPVKVQNASAIQSSNGRRHVVRSGDTLYAISRASGVPVSEIATANRLKAPYQLKVGDELEIPSSTPSVVARAAPPQKSTNAPESVERVSFLTPKADVTSSIAPTAGRVLFEWPVKGSVVNGFKRGAPGERNDGIDIAAPVGTPVRAAADGEVVYRGAGLDGYGNLLLIRHDDGFVTAYAHNDVMLVRKGQQVRQGQVIAKVGQTGAADQPRLHFEIRQNLKAVDPMSLLGT
ncbi:MAG: peptidoglycan DD-metalloendopeptidase family protein [Alphaproteobacteria bacterium]|nr:peptidoglycan DD-metalloendopeptidase family protein [Alphaproteobacteria bacterium]